MAIVLVCEGMEPFLVNPRIPSMSTGADGPRIIADERQYVVLHRIEIREVHVCVHLFCGLVLARPPSHLKLPSQLVPLPLLAPGRASADLEGGG